MHLKLSEDQQMIRETVARLFREQVTPERLRAAERSGMDSALWTTLLHSGLPLMRLPESAGGGGHALLDAVLVAEQAGRCLVPAPLIEVMVATRLLGLLETPAAAEIIGHVAEGSVITLLPQMADAETAVQIPGAAAAEALLMLTGEQIWYVPLSGVEATPVSAGADLYCHARESLEQVAGRRLLAEGGQARSAFLACVEEWHLLTAALLTGLGRRSLEMAAAYAGERRQFGRLIGEYQGVAHPLADALTDIEGAGLLVWRAVWALSQGRQGSAAIAMASWWVATAVPRAAGCALRTFGGYGVSLEYDIQLYFLRAEYWALRFGHPDDVLIRVAEGLLGEGEEPLPEPGEVTVEFGSGQEALHWAERARAFFRSEMSPALHAHAHHSVAGYHPEFNRRLAQAGLLFPHWPVEYGGQQCSDFVAAAVAEVFEEFGWERITSPITNQVAQIIMKYGDEALKSEALPAFARGEKLACLGFTEPASGSDVFAAATRAVQESGQWRITGQKIFTTAANVADYIFLLTRTDANLPKHVGLTLFVVPLSLPGIAIHAVETMQDERTNIVYLDGVRVDDRYRVGDVNGGLAVMLDTLALEHGGNQYRLNYQSMFTAAVSLAKRRHSSGGRLIDGERARRCLAAVATRVVLAECLCHKAIWAGGDRQNEAPAIGPMSKLFSTECYRQDAAALMALFAPLGPTSDDRDAEQIDLGYRQSIGMTIYGGTSEIHRSIIAEQALGMPKSRH